MGRVFANDPRDRGSILGRVIPKTQKMVLDPSYFTLIIRYMSSVKWSNRRKGVAPYPTPWYNSYWKENPCPHPSTTVANFTFALKWLRLFQRGEKKKQIKRRSGSVSRKVGITVFRHNGQRKESFSNFQSQCQHAKKGTPWKDNEMNH